MNPPTLYPALDHLLSGVVHRLGAAASAFVRDPSDEGLWGASGPAEQTLLPGILLTLRPAIGEVLLTGTSRFLPVLAGEVALVRVAYGDEETMGCLIALRRPGWAIPERIALGCMAEAAAASAAHQAEARMREAAELRAQMLEGALRAVDLGVTITDERGRIVYTNPAEARMHGYEVEDLYGREARSLAPPELWSSSPGLPPRRTTRWARERTNVRRDGTRFPVRLCSDAIVDDKARPVGLVTWCEDLTPRDALTAVEIERDPLTGTLTRAAFLRRLENACDAREKEGGEDFALLFIDLDRFKVVNDQYGHAAGDMLLETVGRRLVSCTRPTDAVGRLGGDEFAVLLRGIDRESEAVLVVHRIQRSLGAPATIGGTELNPTASIGISLGAECGSVHELLSTADQAMYRAKALGPGQYGSADAAMLDHESAVCALEEELRRAVTDNRLALRFQPIVSLDDGCLAGFEALVRWNHPTRGMIGPQAFLPIAERTDLIVEIDRWVLRAAARQLRDWSAATLPSRPASLSVNFSGRHVMRSDLVEHTRDVLREFGLEPGQLVVEITETSMVADADAAASALARLRDCGVRLALDDFGTGYSSLSYLRQLPFDVLKIDRSFVQRIGQSEADHTIVRSVVDLARALGLSVTAEGVETAEQENALRLLGCEHAQGYLFAEPVSALEASGWIERDASAHPEP